MDFMKSKTGILLILISVIAVAVIIWYCLVGHAGQSEPNGTFVQREQLKMMNCGTDSVMQEVEG